MGIATVHELGNPSLTNQLCLGTTEAFEHYSIVEVAIVAMAISGIIHIISVEDTNEP